MCLRTSYTEHTITEGEFTALPPRLQETVKRANAVNGGWGGPGQFYSPAPNPGRYKRVGTYCTSPLHPPPSLFRYFWPTLFIFFAGFAGYLYGILMFIFPPTTPRSQIGSATDSSSNRWAGTRAIILSHDWGITHLIYSS